uniref:Uncharacterized protein n=1 Tax=Sphaerodactylus townsendi TaxID=933632 RepID=A0ACB8G5C8_9SAUR
MSLSFLPALGCDPLAHVSGPAETEECYLEIGRPDEMSGIKAEMHQCFYLLMIEDSSQSSRREIRESIFPPIEEENIVEEDTPKARVQEEFTEEPAETPVVEYPHKEPSLQESEEDVSYSDIQELYEPGPLVPKVLEEEETSEELEEFDSVHSLKVRGKAFPKVEPVTVQKSSEDLPQQQPVSLLSTWTTKIKDVDHPFIHHLCTASPRCALPVDLQLVSRVSHTLDKKSHHVPLPAFHPGYYESEDLFPAITLLEKQRETERY